MKKRVVYLLAFVLLILILVAPWWFEPSEYLRNLISGPNFFSYIAYVLFLVLAVVLMPITVMPLIPLASVVLGPLATALLSIIGWTLGGVVAFLLARYLGRPFLSHFISLEKIDKVANLIPPHSRFGVIVLLRFTLPVDIVSYALGLTTSVGLLEYTLATAIGVSWFSFAFAYVGEALLTGNLPIIIELTGISLVIFSVCWYALRRHSKN